MTTSPSASERRWDVYRDAAGEPVTITREQCAALRHALDVWLEVAEAEGYPAAPRIRELRDAYRLAVVEKSCLMGRMLYDGRPPLNEAPPVVNAAPAYYLRDPLLCRKCGHPRSGPGGMLGTSLDPAHASFLTGLYADSTGGRLMGQVRTTVQCVEECHDRGGR